MTKLYTLATIQLPSTAAALFLTLIMSTSFAQQTLEGVVRIKVTETLASKLEASTLSINAQGEVVTGHAPLDQLNRQFRVKRLTRVFPHAGKHEAKHRRYGLHLWYELSADKSIAVSSMLQSYRSERQILKAEPVYKKAVIGSGENDFGPRIATDDALTSALPGSSNDPMLGNQWHYNNTGQTGGTPGADIRLMDAWKVETGNKDVVIAVTDGGIQTDHADLAANMWVNAGEIPGNDKDDDNNGYVDDVHGYSFVERSGKITAGSHATHVGGTIAAVTNNGIGVAGVAGGSNMDDGVRLMSCAVFLDDSTADGFAEAYVYSADNGAVISQNSWGYMFPDVYETVVLEAIDYFIAEAGRDENGTQEGPMSGGLVIFSAGNENTDANFYPAFYEPVLAVASSTHRDTKAKYSNFGAWVDITAPGGETYQAGSQGVFSTLPANQYGYFMGTSMACPHVSGVAGLVLSRFGGEGFSPEMLRERILRSVDNIDAVNTGYEGQLGTGRINAAYALAQNQQLPPNAITDLTVAAKSVGEITLTWTSPADPNDFAAKYDLRYATSPISENNFTAAQTVTGLTAPKPAGQRENFTVKNLAGGKLFYFAIRSADFEGNLSPISNVVSEASALTPSIVVTPASLSNSLKTAAQSTRTFSIRNEGKGPLSFSLRTTEAENDFYTAEPASGIVSPTQEQIITVTFDASRLLTGTYKGEIIIEHNDPGKDSVPLPLTLQVTSNGSAIASLDHDTLDFSSAKIGFSVIRSVVVSNEGSEALIVSEGTSDHPDFRADMASPLEIAAFSSAVLRTIFTPSSTGLVNGVISLHTNDPSSPVLGIIVKGEGLEQPPVTVSPASFHETLQQGSRTTRSMVLTNNGSQNRSYRLEVMNNRQAARTASTSGGRRAAHIDSMHITQQRLLRKRQDEFASRSADEQAILKTIGAARSYTKPSGTTRGKARTSVTEAERYATGFEAFSVGPVGEQNGWYATNNWHISPENPHRGDLHLQGTSVSSGTGQSYVLSPHLFEEYDYPHYTTTVMRINGDRAEGSSWEVVPQDPWSYIATRIRFNANGTIDALVIDNDYAFSWKSVPATMPSGYFELAIEYNNWGSDTSGFPTYHLFVNNRHVFSGTGLASGIGQVAFTSSMANSGPILDVDEFEITGAEYIPQFISTTPIEGTISPGQSVHVEVAFDATVMKIGMYEADLLIHVDAVDTLLIPAALTVTDKMSPGGTILWEKWAGIPGIEISSIPLGTPPDSTRARSLFEAPANTGDNYGTRMRGYVEAPMTGYYTFWIASNDNSELWLGTDEHAGTKRKIAFVTGYSNPRQWDKYATQKSERIYLVANRRYYIEALHKESVGTDHIAVGWQLPDQSLERPISGMHLFPFNGETSPPCAEAGRILREQWNNVPGDITSAIPLEKVPSLTEAINIFESPVNIGDHYGTRIRGFLCVPVSGKYTFWISGNDMSELWLSADSSPANKSKIAHVPGYTDVRQWTKYPSQRSATVDLIAGEKYYIEALHKEGVGTDHIAVGWQLPDGTLERPIPGIRLLPFAAAENELPFAQIGSPHAGDTFVAPATVEISADANDPDGHIAKVEFFAGEKRLGEDSTAPYFLTWSNAPAGEHELTVVATDNLGDKTVSPGVRITVQPVCSASGNITREYWTAIPGDQVFNIPVTAVPDGVETLTTLEGPASAGTNYGARIRGYVCAPETGDYYFWIASNDHSELWLSTDASAGNSVKIASLTRATGPRQWDTFASQKSQAIALVQGKTYYIEALHKQGVGTDHVAVGWQLPNGTMERPIPGNRLSPFIMPEGSLTEREPARSRSYDNEEAGAARLTLYPNPLKGEKLNVVIENLPAMESHIRQIEIRQLTGVPVFSQTLNCAGGCEPGIDIDRNLPSGVYLVQVNVDGRVFTGKLVVP